MNVIALTPRGYCHGVVNAIQTLKTIVNDPTVKRPIYVLGMIVHNQKIVEDFNALGVISLNDTHASRLALIDTITDGTVVITAHGVSDAVLAKAKAKNLQVIDTTCRDVKRSQDTVKQYLSAGYDVLFIGKKSHPETETVLQYAKTVHLIDSAAMVDTLKIKNPLIALTNQTTMSVFDVHDISEKIRLKYPHVEIIEALCDATKTRQLAVMHQNKNTDHCFVVGDKRSHNANKLVEVSLAHGVNASLIQSVEDIDLDVLKHTTQVSVTSGASTPTALTKEVLDFLIQFDKDDPKTHYKISHIKDQNLFL